MSNESTQRTLLVALGICLVCSIFVSAAAVSLKSRQEENKKLEKLKNILQVGDLIVPGKGIEETFNERIESFIIDLETGEPIPAEKYDNILDLTDFDVKVLLNKAGFNKMIPPERDKPQIKKMPRYSIVYKVKDGSDWSEIILPVYGKGLWSTMYGFIALDRDLQTIRGFTFYEHGETPGLGGEVDNPRWKQLWQGKKAFDENGNLIIEVIKGRVDPTQPEANHKIDGLSGSTLTTRGVNNLVNFWLGEDGFGPFLQKIRKEEIHG